MSATLLDRLELATSELQAATMAVIALARSQSASMGDDDQWTRLPAQKSKCQISGVSRGAINRLIALGTIRKRKVGKMAFYSAADWRAHLSDATRGGAK